MTPLPALWESYRRSRATEALAGHTWTRFETEFVVVSRLLGEVVGHEPSEADLTLPNLREAFARYTEGRTNRGEPRAKSTIAGCMSTWTTFLTYLVRDGVITGNPMTGMARPKAPRGTPKPIRGGQETVDRLLSSIARGDRVARKPWPERDLAVVACYAATGLRQQELAGLDVRDLDLSPAGMHLHVRGKGEAERWSPIGPELAEVLQRFQATRAGHLPGTPAVKGTDPLLCNDAGGRLTPANLRWMVRRCYEAAGVQGSVPKDALIHCLRHFFASDLASQGGTATDVQQLLGHRSLTTAQRYIDASAQRAREVAARSSTLTALRTLMPPEERSSRPSPPVA